MNTEIVEVRENKSQLVFPANEHFAKKILYLIWKTISRKFAFFLRKLIQEKGKPMPRQKKSRKIISQKKKNRNRFRWKP